MIYSNHLGSICDTIHSRLMVHSIAKKIVAEFGMLAMLRLTSGAEDIL